MTSVLRIVFILSLLCSWSPDLSAKSSTFSKDISGSKVLYLLLQDVGYQVKRVFSTRTLRDHDLLIVLGTLSKIEGDEVLKWVEEGKTLIVAPSLFDEKGRCETTNFGSLKIERSFELKADKKISAKDHNDLSLRKASCLLKTGNDLNPLITNDHGALAVEKNYHKGRILILAHHDILSNREIDSDDIAVFLRRWIAKNAPYGGKIAFFEFHHGGALWKMLKKSNAWLFALHSLLILLLIYWMVTPRFGDAEPYIYRQRRAFAAHAYSLGFLYQHARQSGYVLNQIFLRFMKRMRGSKSNLIKDNEMRFSREEIAQRLATKARRDQESIESLLAQIEYQAQDLRHKEYNDVLRDFRLAAALVDLQKASGLTQDNTRKKK